VIDRFSQSSNFLELSYMHANLVELKKKLWSAADELRANSELKSSEYTVPVLGLIFLLYAEVKFSHAHQELEGKGTGRRTIGPTDYKARGVIYLPEGAR
jgi:type I restriction enzyme M protein